jgi:hypothetical protein
MILKKSTLYSNSGLDSRKASFILLPMDESTQQNHLKAYGITFWCLRKNYKTSWLLNYRGGSFLLPQCPDIPRNVIRGVSFEVLSVKKLGF